MMVSMMLYDAEGGPLDGMQVPCRWPAGLVLIDKPAGKAMVYDLEQERLVSRGAVLELDPVAAIDTANDDRYDVLAYDREEMGPWR